MAEYLTPGVYVEEIDAGPKPIEGVSTSTAGAVGVTARGPSSGKPELVTSFAEFVRKFGGYLDEPLPALVNQWALNAAEGGRWWLFPLSVKGFFDNGGQRMYVKRVFSGTAVAASGIAGQGVSSEVVAVAKATDTVVRVRHQLGIEATSQVNIFSGGVALAGNPFTVSSYDPTAGSLTLGTALGKELQPGVDFVVPAAFPRVAPAAGPPDTRSITFRAKSVGDWGKALRVQVRPMVGATLKLLPDPALGGAPAVTTLSADAPPATTVLPVASGAGFAAGDRALINGREFSVTAAAAASITINPGVAAGVTWPSGTSVRRMRPANSTAVPSDTVSVAGADQLYVGAFVELDTGTQKERATVLSMVGDRVRLSAPLARAYYADHKLRVVEAEVTVRYAPDDVIQAEEVFPNLRLVDDGSMSYLPRNVNTVSTLVEVQTGGGFVNGDLARFPTVVPPAPNANTLWLPLLNGADNLGGLTVDDFVGVDGGSGKRTGVQALEDIDEISICLAPDVWSTTVHTALIDHCEILKDRFAVLDPRDGLSIQGIREVRETIDTKYAALYYPWIEVRDPSVGRNVNVAPSGHLAGIYARVDVERGVHKAPANEVIRGITKIAQDVTDREQAMLNPRGINALRSFPNRGNRVWGARTLTSDSSWKYVNVRRLFIYVEESIDEGTQWVVFEPNDEATWARVRLSVTNFLTTVWRNGALEGLKAEEAFFVRCDRTTMTQDDIDNGRLICVIGIAPVKPAEFVIFRIQQKTRDVLG